MKKVMRGKEECEGENDEKKEYLKNAIMKK